jgi:hypothetical protein
VDGWHDVAGGLRGQVASIAPPPLLLAPLWKRQSMSVAHVVGDGRGDMRVAASVAGWPRQPLTLSSPLLVQCMGVHWQRRCNRCVMVEATQHVVVDGRLSAQRLRWRHAVGHGWKPRRPWGLSYPPCPAPPFSLLSGGSDLRQ